MTKPKPGFEAGFFRSYSEDLFIVLPDQFTL